MKETRLSRKEFNLLVNDILLDVKPIKLRISIANRLVEFFDKKQEQIAELEEQLKNAIVPKFKIGQEVWYVYNKIQLVPVKVIISDFSYYGYRKHKILYDSENYYEGMPECCLFATKEEAQAKMEELQGE